MGTLFYNAVLKDIDPNPAMAYLMVTATLVIVFNIARRHRLRLPRSEDPH